MAGYVSHHHFENGCRNDHPPLLGWRLPVLLYLSVDNK